MDVRACAKDDEVPKTYEEFLQLIEKRAELSVFICSVMSNGFDPAPLVSCQHSLRFV